MIVESRAVLLVDLGFGDSGKGLISDYLCRREGVRTIVRYSGGSNAGHNVHTPDGRHATFVQVGAGSFLPGVRTLISRFMLLNPTMLEREVLSLEEKGVRDLWPRLLIDRDVQIVMPQHIALNRLRERVRGDGRLGSTGQGVSEAVRQRRSGTELPTVADLTAPKLLRSKLRATYEWARAEVDQLGVDLSAEPWRGTPFESWLSDDSLERFLEELLHFAQQPYRTVSSADLPAVFRDGSLLFEGSQGVLLDPEVGFAPYTTSTRTTLDAALALLEEAKYEGAVERLGVIRTYATRHGPGPFVSESIRLRERVVELHNHTNPDQGTFRVGHLDLVALSYANGCLGGVDSIALTHCDTLPAAERRVCLAYTLPETVGQREMEQLFDLRDGQVVSIKSPRRYEPRRQLALSEALLTLHPQLSARMPLAGLASTIERKLGARVSLIASGPTADDVQRVKGAAGWPGERAAPRRPTRPEAGSRLGSDR